MVDIQISVYHYKTGDMQLLKYSKCMKIKKKTPLPCPLTFMVWHFFCGDFVIIRKTV